MINFFKALFHIIMVVLFTISMCFSMIFTFSIAINDHLPINTYIPFAAFILNAIAMFLLGGIYTKNEADATRRIVNRDINKNYNDIVAFINLARYLISKDTPKIIDDYIKSTRKKADLEKLE